MFLAIYVGEDLALEHVEHLVIARMQVKGRGLAEHFAILKQGKRAACLCGARLSS